MSSGKRINDVSDYILFMSQLEKSYWSGEITYLGFLFIRAMTCLAYPQFTEVR